MSRPEDDLQYDADRARSWLLGRAMPFWSQHGIDRNGLAHEELSFDGHPAERGYRRAMVQFRQVYVFAVGGMLGACSPGVARGLFSRAVDLFWHPEGGFVHRIAPDGSALDTTRDAYDQAFALFAAAWLHRADPAAGALGWAHRTLDHLEARMRAPRGGYLDALPARLPWRQNPHMHLFEACLALYGATQDRAFLERARELAGLLHTRFLNEWGAIEETFGEDFSHPVHFTERHIEPGHHYEWASLLVQYALATSDPEPADLARALHRFARRQGTTALGLPCATLDPTGRPLGAHMKLWAVCEAIKSELALGELGDQRDHAAISTLVDALFRHFLEHASAPVWWEGIDRNGAPERTRMPASTLYHLTYACSELLRCSGRATALQPSWRKP